MSAPLVLWSAAGRLGPVQGEVQGAEVVFVAHLTVQTRSGATTSVVALPLAAEVAAELLELAGATKVTDGGGGFLTGSLRPIKLVVTAEEFDPTVRPTDEVRP